MPSAESRLAAVVAPAVARGRTLFVNFDGEDPLRAAEEAETFDQDLRAHRSHRTWPGARFGAWASAEEPYDGVVVRLAPETERLRMLLAMARSCVRADGLVTVVGRNDAGIRSAGKALRELVGEPETVDYRFHCRALCARAERPLPERARLSDWEIGTEWRGLRVRSLPGVFAHGRVDPATELLLSHVQVGPGEQVLDVGCGAGVIGAWAARVGARAVLVDLDAVAVEAARATLAANDLTGTVAASDLYSDVEGPFDRILSNPPFHAGVDTTLAAARRLIEEAPARLEPGGELWLVANRFLDYLTPMEKAFGTAEVLADDGRYRVLRARVG